MSFRSSCSALLIVLLTAPAARASETIGEVHVRAWLLVGQGRIEEAIPVLKSVIEQAPDFYPAYATLGQAVLRGRAGIEAETYLRSMFHDPARSALAHYGMGLLEEQRQQPERAADHFTACIRERPESTACYPHLAVSLMTATSLRATLAGLTSRMAGDRSRPYGCLAVSRFLGLERKTGHSLQQARDCLAEAARSGSKEFLAAAHHEAADASQYTGHLDEFLANELEALRLERGLNDPERVFERTMEVCGGYLQLDRYAEAEACVDPLVASAREQQNRAHLRLALGRKTDHMIRSGDLDGAVASATECLSLAEEDGDAGEAAATWLLRGKIYLTRGDFLLSRRDCEDAWAATRSLGLRGLEAYALRELSKTYALTGDPILALRYADASISIFRELGREYQAGAGIGNLPEIYAAMGDWPSALRFARQSRQSAVRFEDPLEQQDTLIIEGGILLRMGRAKEAKRRFGRSLAMGEATKHPGFRTSGLLGLASAHLALRENEQAARRFEEALQLARQTGNTRAVAGSLAELGRCYRRMGRVERAREHLDSAIEIAAGINLVEVSLPAHRELAELARREGRYREAYEHLRTAAQTVEAFRGRIPTAELKADFAREHAKLYEDLVFLLARLDRREPGKGWDRKAFDYAERGRARAFLDQLAETKAEITKGLNPAQVKRRNQLETGLSRTMAALVERDSAANRRAADQAESELAEWARSIRTTNPEYEALRYPRPVDAAGAAAIAAAHSAAILEYAVGGRESYLWVITSHRFRMFRLPARSAVDRAVSEYRAIIAGHPVGARLEAWVAPAGALGDMLAKPALPYLAAARAVLIVPDGSLHYLPFETLRPAGANGDSRCLIERYPIYYMPSVSVVVQLDYRHPSQPRRFDLLAYGDPVFSRQGGSAVPDGSVVRAIYASAGIHLSPLPNTRHEVESIGRLFEASRRTIRLGAEATEISVKQARLTDYRLLHFATHSVIDDHSPTRSGIVLSLVNTGGEDGILRINEVYNLDMDADLVVLSACQTGIGHLIRGEGMTGLTRAFLYAGARQVAVSLWDVADLTAPEFMQAFYLRLHQGEAPGPALRAAKLAMLHSGSPALGHPYFWAPFVLEGAPESVSKIK